MADGEASSGSRAVDSAASPAGLSRPVLFALLVVLAVAGVLRALEAAATPLWFDEIYIVFVARQSIPALLRTVASDIHPPLQFLLRWLWIRIGGDGELWQKSLSILFALASIAATFRLGRRLFGAAAGLLAAALLTVLSAHVHYSQEVEDYSLGWLLFVLAIDAGWTWVASRRTRDAAGLAVWSTLALYNHYLAMFVLGVLAAWGAVTLRRDRAACLRWLGIFGIVAILFLPQLLVFLAQLRREAWGSFFSFPSREVIVALWRMMSFSILMLVPLLLALSALPLLRGSQRPAAILLWLLSTLPLLSQRVWVLILPREGLYVASLWLLLVAAGVTGLRARWLAGILSAGLLAIGARSLSKHQLWQEPLALSRVEKSMRRQVTPGDLIVHAETHSLLYFLYNWPEARNRLLVPAGKRVPYFDGGLVVPDSCYLAPARWDEERRGGTKWWGVIVDRALATRGGVFRAGAEVTPGLLAAARDTLWRVPPVTVIEGTR